MRKSLRSRLLLIFSSLLSWCPRVLQWRLASLISGLAVVFGIRSAITTQQNLRHCYPDLGESELRRLVKASLVHTVMLLLETGMIFHWSENQLSTLIGGIEGEELLHNALNERRGVVLLVPHFGNWEFLALYLGRFDLVALYDPPRQRFLEAPVKQSRERTGAIMVPLDRSGLRSALRTLHDGGLLGILPDQVPDRNAGQYVPFFDKPALTMTLVHRLIRQTSPLVLLGSAVRSRTGFDLYFSEVSEAISSADPDTALTALNEEIEGLIDKAPAQYQWEYKRFKSSREGAAKIY